MTPQVEMIDVALRRQLDDPFHPMHRYLVDFFLHLAVNHAVVVETDQRGIRRCVDPVCLCSYRCLPVCLSLSP